MSNEISNFQTICTDWGKWFSKQHGTTCNWVRLHAEGKAMKQYNKYKIKVEKCEGPHVVRKIVTEAEPYLYDENFTNDTDIEQSSNFEHKVSMTATFTSSVTSGIKVGLDVSSEIEIPLEAKEKIKLSTEINLSSTQSKTVSKTQEWSISQPVKVPPHKKVNAAVCVNKMNYDIDYTMDVVISGFVAIWNKSKIDLGDGKHWLYFFPVAHVLIDKPYPGYAVRGNKVVFTTKGKIKGVQGVEATVVLTQQPLPDQGVVKKAKLTNAQKDAIPLSSLSANADLLPVKAGTETTNLINPVIGYIPDDVGSQLND